jgi:hypothetical protein
MPLRGSIDSLPFELQKHAWETFQDQQRRSQDLILLKIAAELSRGLLKLTMIAALRRLSQKGYHSVIRRIVKAASRLLMFHDKSTPERSERELWFSKVLLMLDIFPIEKAMIPVTRCTRHFRCSYHHLIQFLHQTIIFQLNKYLAK